MGLVVLAGVTVLIVRHANDAMQATLPKDMPADARFLQTGYDLDRNEAQGTWIACRADTPQSADFCRVTDQRGMVLYEGDFLPVDSGVPLPDGDLKVSSAMNASAMWIRGAAENAPVPVIKLESGSELVPQLDRLAVAQQGAISPMTAARAASSY